MERFKAWGALFVTIVTALIAIWWLYLVAQRLGDKPVIENGAVVLDEWGRAKDILLVVLPLFSASLAYWVGAQGAKEAKEDANEAKAEAKTAKKQLDAVLDTSPQGVLERAKETHPDAFAPATR